MYIKRRQKNKQILDNHSICRFCMNLIGSEDGIMIPERAMLEKYLPELEGDGIGDISDIKNEPDEEENQYIKEMEEQRSNNVIQCSSKSMFMSEDDDHKIDIKLEEMDCKEFLSCGEIEIKTEQDDFDSSKNTNRSSTVVSSIQTNCKGLQNHKLMYGKPSEIIMFKCDNCPYQTRFKHHLQRHMLIHKNPSEIKMFECEFCPYRARFKCYLRKHMLIHKNPSEITMVKCASCSFQTKRKCSLHIHMLIHKNPSEIEIFECEYCLYQTKIKAYLRRHRQIHKNPSELKMFKCDDCPYRTRIKQSLQRHRQIHKNRSEVKMFKCDNCPYQTRLKSNLPQHMVTHRKLQK